MTPLLVGLALLNSCATGASPSIGQMADVTESSAFRAVVQHLRMDSTVRRDPRAVLRVDPRPLRPDSELAIVRPETRAQISAEELAGRIATLHLLGIAEGDASFPLDCGGTMVPDYPGSSEKKGCPAAHREAVAIALPRAGDATSPTRAVADGRFWTSRVIIVSSGPYGITAEARDYVLEQLGGRWRVVKMVTLAYWE